MSNMTQEALEKGKGLAPWRTSLPWWVVLLEGIVLGGIGLLVLLDPGKANIRLALILTAALVVAGLLQLWDVLRSRAPESIDSAAGARAGIAIFAGVVVFILYFVTDDIGQKLLTIPVGLIIFGSASLIYGLLGIVMIFGTRGAQRRTAIVETLFFTAIGALMLYTQFAGPEAVTTAATIGGWLALGTGVLLIGLAIWRQQKGEQADEVIDSVVGVVDRPDEDSKPRADATQVEKPQ
ncbi:MAG: hypothetical protein U9R25_04650 [Chloroflexota bacterium]|nr:hypothetical protein [Chloroflexota bacterium]